MSTPKNLIIITSDEMRGDCPGFMGNPDCQTPFLDAFAQRGVVFNRHFTVHGKCVPSRVALTNGRYAHTDGIRTVNETNLWPNDQPDLLSTLKAQGFETAAFGHNHTWANFWGGNVKSGGVVDYHSYTKDYFAHFTERQWPVPAPGPDSVTPMHLSKHGFDYGGRIEQPLTGFVDDNRAEQAIEYLTNVRDRSRPFYLHLNFGAPHPAYKVEEPYFSMYDRQAITAWPHALPENAPLPFVKMREIRTGVDEPEEAFREIQAVYYGMITKVDTLIGRVLACVEEQGLLEDSVVMFWVDHGDFAGEYGLVEKWDTAMQDCILHVPQILYAPTLPQGVRIDSLTEHTDLAPTLLDLLGVAHFPGIHGESLLPVIQGEKRKEAVFADGGHEDAMHRRFSFDKTPPTYAKGSLNGKQVTYRDYPDTMARTKMVRTDKWKLVIRLRGGNELYDMEHDPQELHNRYGDPTLAPVVLDLQQKMIEWCLRTDTDRPYQENVGA